MEIVSKDSQETQPLAMISLWAEKTKKRTGSLICAGKPGHYLVSSKEHLTYVVTNKDDFTLENKYEFKIKSKYSFTNIVYVWQTGNFLLGDQDNKVYEYQIPDHRVELAIENVMIRAAIGKSMSIYPKTGVLACLNLTGDKIVYFPFAKYRDFVTRYDINFCGDGFSFVSYFQFITEKKILSLLTNGRIVLGDTSGQIYYDRSITEILLEEKAKATKDNTNALGKESDSFFDDLMPRFFAADIQNNLVFVGFDKGLQKVGLLMMKLSAEFDELLAYRILDIRNRFNGDWLSRLEVISLDAGKEEYLVLMNQSGNLGSDISYFHLQEGVLQQKTKTIEYKQLIDTCNCRRYDYRVFGENVIVNTDNNHAYMQRIQDLSGVVA